MVGGVVVLGKFDVLYVGYCVLVEYVVEIGVLFLVLFVGMVEVFGWEVWYDILFFFVYLILILWFFL